MARNSAANTRLTRHALSKNKEKLRPCIHHVGILLETGPVHSTITRCHHTNRRTDVPGAGPAVLPRFREKAPRANLPEWPLMSFRPAPLNTGELSGGAAYQMITLSLVKAPMGYGYMEQLFDTLIPARSYTFRRECTTPVYA